MVRAAGRTAVTLCHFPKGPCKSATAFEVEILHHALRVHESSSRPTLVTFIVQGIKTIMAMPRATNKLSLYLATLTSYTAMQHMVIITCYILPGLISDSNLLHSSQRQ